MDIPSISEEEKEKERIYQQGFTEGREHGYGVALKEIIKYAQALLSDNDHS